MLRKVTLCSIDRNFRIDPLAEAVIMRIPSPGPALTRPRPEKPGSGPVTLMMGGEGGNARSRLTAMIGTNGLLATALLLSAILVGLTAAVLNWA